MELIRKFDVNSDSLCKFKSHFPEKVSLGEINLKYFCFLTALNMICNYAKANTLAEEQKKLSEQLAGQKVLLQQTQKTWQTSKNPSL